MYELKNAIDVYTYQTGDRAPVIEKIQTISTTSTKNPGNMTAACAMRLSWDQKYIYCSNAGENTISVYRRDEGDGPSHHALLSADQRGESQGHRGVPGFAPYRVPEP